MIERGGGLAFSINIGGAPLGGGSAYAFRGASKEPGACLATGLVLSRVFG